MSTQTEALPDEARDLRPLRVLFLDLNSYFASVEQAERPELRGKPVAVVPLMADTTFVIAASYEAKRFGVKTVMRVDEAKRRCPDLILVEGRPPLYVHYHRRVIEVAESILPVDRVCSIDEMRFRLLGLERQPAMARELAVKLKKAIREQVAESMTCSIGIAPNSFLAKLATEMQKPDGLVVLQGEELPGRLQGLKLTDFPGINRRMEARLKARGIFCSDDLIARSAKELKVAFGGYHGERWWSMLRGYDVNYDIEEGKTLSHSHVLPPALRNDKGCRDVLLRLAHKAAARLRSKGLWATHMGIRVSGRQEWHAHCSLPPTQDSMTVTERVLEMWERRDYRDPLSVGVVFSGLLQPEEVTPSLFDDTVGRARLSQAVDLMNQKFGKNSIFLASLDKTKDKAGEKIAFNKTWLFSEGKGDNEWPDTFRGGAAE
ncbi:MAG: DNA polymerase [Armatimonadetes bacterium]|nr:DNA polymerase [Armatimonadota bacterium]